MKGSKMKNTNKVIVLTGQDNFVGKFRMAKTFTTNHILSGILHDGSWNSSDIFDFDNTLRKTLCKLRSSLIYDRLGDSYLGEESIIRDSYKR
jgi:hypothetical protein